MHPVLAIKSATINTAREIGVSHIGAVAPGYTADMVLTKDIHTMGPTPYSTAESWLQSMEN